MGEFGTRDFTGFTVDERTDAIARSAGGPDIELVEGLAEH